ncbi:uncharacterized protein LY79DRAFT_555199 [Colletotrichum navitas]|uniref:Uncharacterized protein n=1 Tax=Colletotrichum navitas TaxID=681940 RepID=A0AAD8PYY6_9PEZI|nr:uncharacterized protein LY79DRAFT_555199 [Colletotrichum navitas]KAK1590138.1 hypothetical protein LY79DRAFT_555199 [Colletotrichum navitas]
MCKKVQVFVGTTFLVTSPILSSVLCRVAACLYSLAYCYCCHHRLVWCFSSLGPNRTGTGAGHVACPTPCASYTARVQSDPR